MRKSSTMSRHYNKYIETFKRRWIAYLEKGTEFRHKIITSPQGRYTLIAFIVCDDFDDEIEAISNEDCWRRALEGFEQSLNIITDIGIDVGLFSLTVCDDGIFVIKHSPKQYWTIHIANIDAQSALVRRMPQQPPPDSS